MRVFHLVHVWEDDPFLKEYRDVIGVFSSRASAEKLRDRIVEHKKKRPSYEITATDWTERSALFKKRDSEEKAWLDAFGPATDTLRHAIDEWGSEFVIEEIEVEE